MATYYNRNNNNNNNNNNNSNSEIQGEGSDGLQTLVLMNSNTPYHSHHLGSFSDTTQSNNNSLVFLNSLNPRSLPHAPMQHQHLVGIPLHPTNNNHPPHHHHHESTQHSNFMPRVHYNMYPTTTDPSLAARETTRAQQGGLSLSLSRSSPRSEVANGGLLGSRYLKAAQELLDEVVSVGKEEIKNEYEKNGGGVGGGGGGGEVGRKGERREISTTERQEILMKKAKLVGLLDEVEQRYRQYHHQMQIVISWFEQATGTGSAKTYTALALQTISKQFRCLKDAISTQIRASSKSLGEEESFGVGKSESGSRLKFVDHQIRQQRALQQLGMIQPNAWRPQRGLPERSVSVLRAWLFEHFLHPYPKDSDKIMLAKQTGLTRSQVSNWFINARVRLWKPMVEEMYTEEIKEHNGENSNEKTTKKVENSNENSSSKFNSQKENTSVTENNNLNFKSMLDTPTSQNSPTMISVSPSSTGVNIRHPPGFTLIGSQDMEAIANSSPKKQRNTMFMQSPESYLSNEQISMKFDNERQNRESFTLMGGPTNFIGEFGGYPISEINRFGDEQFPTTYSGNGVALTLGLPHCENLSQNFLQNQNIQMGRRLELGEANDFDAINASNTSHSSVAYESVNIQNRKRFAAQLLPDFVT